MAVAGAEGAAISRRQRLGALLRRVLTASRRASRSRRVLYDRCGAVCGAAGAVARRRAGRTVFLANSATA